MGTSGRILEQFAQRKLKGVTTIMLDEPDPILAAAGGDFLREVLSRPEPKVQLILAGATLGAQAVVVGVAEHAGWAIAEITRRGAIEAGTEASASNAAD